MEINKGVDGTSVVPAEHPLPAASPSPRSDRYIRYAAWLAVLGLIGIAFYVSYRHLRDLALTYGEAADTAQLFPLTVDGLIVVASIVMLHCARSGRRVPVLAWLALVIGIGATFTANAAHGIANGWPGALVSASSAVTLVISYELLMWLIRTTQTATPATPVERVVYRDVPGPSVTVQAIPFDRYEAARLAYEDSLTPGAKKLGRRVLATRYGISEREAAEVMNSVRAESGEDTEQVSLTPLDTTPIDHPAPAAINGHNPVHHDSTSN